MMKNNPFENSRELDTGFYFDKSKKVICFAYKDDGSEMYGPSLSIYNRLSKSNERGIISFLREDPGKSDANDLVELRVELLQNKDNLIRDFSWILDNPEVSREFVSFLLREEKYLILELFKTYTNSKIKSNNGRSS